MSKEELEAEFGIVWEFTGKAAIEGELAFPDSAEELREWCKRYYIAGRTKE